ncbi:hypothetical protein [Kushneria phyllosphaerae]|uniref:Uncharacterized protein n=1 Tax=Kushneria phyllosphaerae TaxID=2100822 RepID=A0A2R8CIE5_9GAMM|nr:hypothetical protein [Kushneria phyllosphaerae]SPJ32665.1 hypothetical protein KSP9073_00666 [Kushneria phyllosphaerae]
MTPERLKTATHQKRALPRTHQVILVHMKAIDAQLWCLHDFTSCSFFNKRLFLKHSRRDGTLPAM